MTAPTLRERVAALAEEWEADHGIVSPDSRYTRDVLVRELRALLADDPEAPRIEDVLAEHGALGYDVDGCECGADVRTHDAHRAHVAQAIREAGAR